MTDMLKSTQNAYLDDRLREGKDTSIANTWTDVQSDP
jgi:hypothetical protein